MNNEYVKKPPLGATPAWLGATRRIVELAKAINRTATDYSAGDEYRMKNWAKEIMMQCDILSDFPPGSEPKVPIPAMLFHALNNQNQKESDGDANA